MFRLHSIFSAFVAAGLAPALLAAPAPQMSLMPNVGNEGAVGGVDVTALPTTTAMAASGSLYGPHSLLGEIVAPSPVSGGNSAQVTNYELVNGQEADSDLGLYLNFASVEDPQPIRGTTGQTDSGPRECIATSTTFLG